jgi:hypothetical protein
MGYPNPEKNDDDGSKDKYSIMSESVAPHLDKDMITYLSKKLKLEKTGFKHEDKDKYRVHWASGG